MGSGAWSPRTYHDRASARAATGKDVFDYSTDAVRSGMSPTSDAQSHRHAHA